MDMLQSVLLGVVQGLTEFLPVSSSGHLAVVQALFGIQEVPLFYDVMLHVGTLVAVFIVLWPEIKAIICHPVKNKLGMLIIATIPAVVVVLVMKQVFPAVYDNLQNGKYLAFGFFATTAVLVISELIARRMEHKRKIGLPQAVVMGVMQAGATMMPGLSRSGSTIAGGLFMGTGRERAAKFAFLMSIPAIIGSALFTAKDVVETGMGDVSIPMVIIGMIAAAVCGFLAIKFMLRLISKHKLYGFAIYTAALGVIVLLEATMYGNVFISPFA
ncbi:undecaprenyl-diphosphate phosphatase [Christensenellaceae bacterium OttesenSCG-928-K19]|nr:undecaprenyl-diphosphate phosphatase [Christensenellaceae bacterium OttesenSCG-928-K19]